MREIKWIRRENVCVFAKGITLLFPLAVIFCGAYVGFGCNRRINDIFSGIEGTVVERVTGLAVDSAWISLNDSTSVDAYTDSLGHFAIATLGLGQRDIYAGKEGYLTTHKVIELSSGEGGTIIVLELEKVGETKREGKR